MNSVSLERDSCVKAPVKIAKDKNGVGFVTLRNPRGFSAQVSCMEVKFFLGKTNMVKKCYLEVARRRLFPASFYQNSNYCVYWTNIQTGMAYKANSKPPAAVRAGIPICFSQFGNRGSLEQHGFARNKIWEIDYNPPPPLHHNECDGKAFIDLLLKPSEDDMKIWPHSFEFRLRVLLTCDGALKLISRIRNIGYKAFSFSIAYHMYFLVSDIGEVRVEGLETLNYLDNLHHKERFTEQGDSLTFEKEVDRVYIGSPHMVGVFDHEKRRTFLIRKGGLPDADGAAVEKPITLKPGEEFTGRLELSALT